MRHLWLLALLLATPAAATKMEPATPPAHEEDADAPHAAMSVHLGEDPKPKHGKALGHEKQHGHGHAWGHHKMTEVPEPLAVTLLGAGLLAMALVVRRPE